MPENKTQDNQQNMPAKLQLEYAEFYITNSCNFNCSGCNRFNNYSFVGMQRWSDYAPHYRQWADILNLDRWTILGGEPMMNPTYLDWLENICKLWPNSQGSFLTNGHYLDKNNRDLYDIIKSTNGQVTLNIGLHNINRREQMLTTVQSWLHGAITVQRTPKNLRDVPNFDQNWQQSYETIRDPSWPDCDTIDYWDALPEHVKQECRETHQFSPKLLADLRKGWQLTDVNGVTVHIEYENFFHQGALKVDSNQNFSLHSSNPEQAHAICHSKKCHHFDKGQLFKCGQVSLFKEFDQQFNLNISDQDRNLIYDYQPGQLDQDRETLEKFINNIDQPLAQCKFCPDQYKPTQIFAAHNQKIKIIRKSK